MNDPGAMYGAIIQGNTSQTAMTKEALRQMARSNPSEVIILKTKPHQFAGPLPLAPRVFTVGGPDVLDPEWIAVVERMADGSWSVS